MYHSLSATVEAFEGWQEVSKLYQSRNLDEVDNVNGRLKES